MDDRQTLGFKGPVWKVAEVWQAPFASTKKFAFGRDGMLIAGPPDIEVREDPGGIRIEVQSVAGLDAWSMDSLNGVCFITRGAAIAETSYSSHGSPIETVLRSERNDPVSRIRYVCDDKGRIIEAQQHNLADPPLPPQMAALPRPAAGAVLDALRNFAGTEADLRVTFEYDQGNRVVEQSQYFGERLHLRIICAYNEDGDKVTFASSGEETYRFAYEYDQRRNWTRQVVQHPLQTVECRRQLTYYDE
jgi:hypothetical protein